MAIAGLTIIGESINDSVPSTAKIFEANDLAGIQALAKKQDAGGAAYIDVNVGRRSPEFMAKIVKLVQEVTSKPLSIDSPDFDLAKAGLEAYDPKRAGGQKPVLNSISPLRLQLFDLYQVRPFKPVLMVSEMLDAKGDGKPCETAEEIYQAAKSMMKAVRDSGHRFPNEDCIIDPAISPIGSDTQGHTKRLLKVLEMLKNDPEFKGVHRSVGLSNFTVMLPSKRPGGEPVKGPLESALLTKAMPLGLDMIIGSTGRNYELLKPDHPAMVCLEEVLKLDAFDALMRLQEFYSA